jgi:hypothetical protein
MNHFIIKGVKRQNFRAYGRTKFYPEKRKNQVKINI